jgi:nucleotide sugar dehydrogenase
MSEEEMFGTEEMVGMEQPKLKIGIVGHGFVGGAVDYAFTHPDIEKFYVDPKYDTTIDDLLDWQPNVSFVCAPTPMHESGFVDASIVEDAVLKLLEHTKGGVVVKSTIPPDVVDRLYRSTFEDDIKRLTINPEFLTESNAKEQFVNAEYHVIGGYEESCQGLAQLYSIYSLCTAREYIFMSGPEAAFVKYGVNSYLATKVTFFNQLHDSIYKFGGNFPTVVNAIGRDERIGLGHTRVPGYDGKRGFGGACFPKDCKAFTMFDTDLTLIEKCVSINNDYRKQYELDEREESNNVKYNGQTEEEQQDQDNGSVVGE